MATKYFKFQIGTNADGSRISYSPGWHGTSDHCPQNVVVDLYNDKEGYGIAHTEDTFIPVECEARDKVAVDKHLAEIKVEKGVYVGTACQTRWADEEKARLEKELADKTIAEAIALEDAKQVIEAQKLEELEKVEPIVGEV
jgi:hypothetical protein